MARAYTAKSSGGLGPRVIATVVFGVFLAAGCAMGYFMIAKPIGGMVQGLFWSSAECTVVNSYVMESSGGKSSTYRPLIRYRYNVAGRDYTSEQYSFFDTSSSGRSGKEATVAEYPAGRTFTCYYDPSNPQRAVIYGGPTWPMLVGLFPLIFIGVGVVGVYSILRGARSGAMTGNARVGGINFATAISNEFPSANGSYPMFVESRNNPFSALAVMLVIAGIWNGIVSIFLYHALSGSSIQIGVLLFMIPFCLVGLFLLVMVGKAILALFNPKLTLKITPAALGIGGRGQLAWSVSGSSEKISKLTATLVGEESATYRRGTDTTTARERFYRKEIASVTLAPQIKSGSASFEIPADSMHTFNGRNNKIKWFMEVKGEIPNWPDLEHTIDLTVTASRAGGI